MKWDNYTLVYDTLVYDTLVYDILVYDVQAMRHCTDFFQLNSTDNHIGDNAVDFYIYLNIQRNI